MNVDVVIKNSGMTFLLSRRRMLTGDDHGSGAGEKDNHLGSGRTHWTGARLGLGELRVGYPKRKLASYCTRNLECPALRTAAGRTYQDQEFRSSLC